MVRPCLVFCLLAICSVSLPFQTVQAHEAQASTNRCARAVRDGISSLVRDGASTSGIRCGQRKDTVFVTERIGTAKSLPFCYRRVSPRPEFRIKHSPHQTRWVPLTLVQCAIRFETLPFNFGTRKLCSHARYKQKSARFPVYVYPAYTPHLLQYTPSGLYSGPLRCTKPV